MVEKKMLLAIIFGVYVEVYIFFELLCRVLYIYKTRLGNYLTLVICA